MPSFLDVQISAPPTIFDADTLVADGTDQSAKIQAIIDSVPAGAAGIVRLPVGHFHFSTGWGVFDQDNITIAGAGIDKTIIDFSVLAPIGCAVPPHYAAMSVIEGTWGHLIADTTSFDTVLNNIVFQDFTLKVSSSSSVPSSTKALVVGSTRNCIVERIKLDGGYWEGIYHYDKNGNLNHDTSKNWVVRNCEMLSGRSSAINSNNQFLDGYSLYDNYIHDGGYGLGILMVGNNGIIRHNRLVRAAYISIAESFFKNIIIDGNEIIEPISGGAVYGVFVEQDPTINANDSIQVINNIFDSLDASIAAIAVRVIGGNCRVAGNIFKGRKNGVAGNATGIQVSPANNGGGGIVQIVDNQFEALIAGVSDYNYAIVVDGAGMSAFVDGNVIGSNVAASGWLYNDASAIVMLGKNVVNGISYLEAVYTFNSDSAMNGSVVGLDDLIFIDNGNVATSATPNVRRRKQLAFNGFTQPLITNFVNGYVGQELILHFQDSSVTIQHNSNIRLVGGVNFAGTANDVLKLIRNANSVWVEAGRSVNP